MIAMTYTSVVGTLRTNSFVLGTRDGLAVFVAWDKSTILLHEWIAIQAANVVIASKDKRELMLVGLECLQLTGTLCHREYDCV